VGSQELITAGDHLARCHKLELGVTSTGKEQAKITFVLCDENDFDNDRVITGYLYFSDKAMKHAIRSLRAMGWAGDDIDELPALADAKELYNIVRLTIEHDEYKGKVSHKVKWINDPNESADKPLDADKRKALRDRMKAAIAEANGSPGPAPTATADDMPEWCK
jgi:hypothetical protein